MKFGDPDTIYAEVIADSVSESGQRLTTMEVQCHRFVLAEFNTHRAFSRNSASSRAIPVSKMLERVRMNPAIPLEFPAEQRGMQGGEILGEDEAMAVKAWWLDAARNAVASAEYLNKEFGVHKSVVNRLLEPFLYHRIIVSSTEWENFFAQRCSPLAQPEIREVAKCMRDALHLSHPVPLPYGAWHLPYVDSETWEAISKSGRVELGKSMYPIAQAISCARCARVSYMTHEGRKDIDADLSLFEKLIGANPPHWSPLEHVATPCESGVELGNFFGWQQLRHLIGSE